eukprot:gene7520-9813_t
MNNVEILSIIVRNVSTARKKKANIQPAPRKATPTKKKKPSKHIDDIQIHLNELPETVKKIEFVSSENLIFARASNSTEEINSSKLSAGTTSFPNDHVYLLTVTSRTTTQQPQEKDEQEQEQELELEEEEQEQQEEQEQEQEEEQEQEQEKQQQQYAEE